jgi:hypothetical protein
MSKVLCSVATRGRYFTTLPLVLNAIINQTRRPDKLVVFDDNDEPQDMRKEMIYSYFFQMLEIKGIEWEWVFAEKKGQHHIHQRANTMEYDWVWRVDDDAIPEPNVLEELYSWVDKWPDLGAVGSHIWTPPYLPSTAGVSGRIDNIDSEPNIQWGKFSVAQEVDHLHCSFLYRAGIADYNLGLSRVAHREETLFTYQLQQKGYSILVVPNAITWHMKNPEGGIRSETKKEMYEHDEYIFRNILQYRGKTIVVLDCGLGDHVVFSHVLPSIHNAEVFTCYPEVVPGRSIEEAKQLFGDITMFNVYQKMDQWKWKDSLENAYRKLYS